MSSENVSCMKYWEEKGAQKDFSTPFQMEVFNKHVSKSAEIIDVGCGYGRIMNVLRDAGYENIKGVEPSAALRSRGAAVNGSLPILALEGGKIPFENKQFDAALLIAVLTCVPADQEQSELINEIYRVLKPGGVIYINDFLLNTDQRNLDRYNQYESRHGCYGVFELEGEGVLRHFSKEHIEQLLSPFTTLEYTEITYTTMNGNKSNGFYYIGIKQ